VTFGPLFMTRIAGTVSPEKSGGLVFTGVAMLATGLVAMAKIIANQQKVIEKLGADSRRVVG
jgi:hypothetical protein